MAENSGKDFFVGTIIGAAVGASLALLFAPKSGKELRGDINQGAIQVRDRATEWKDVAQAKGEEWKNVAQEKGQEWKELAVVKGSEIKQKTQDLTSNVQTKLQDLKDKTKSSDEVPNTDVEEN
ncbi:YtxH domain-containing protein [Ornithinibacillus contaminans]|uniref:YtxH domain-containing protein n=1 Tax=Ornithinibacillus contaminans TaxID=694055 RepID=UPI00064DE152|nr:YtxH domain-containing protein [Ornithinibacillus contaminans]